MNTLAIVFFAALAAANAGLLPLYEQGALLKGPSARSTLVRPDGLISETHFEGGVVAEDVAPVVPAVVPEVVVARHEPIVAPVVPHVPLVPTWEHGRSDIIAGPSGTIVTNKDYVSPIVPVIPEHREIIVEPTFRSYVPTYHHGFAGYRSGLLHDNLFLNHGLYRGGLFY